MFAVTMEEPVKYNGEIIGSANIIIEVDKSKIIYIDKISISLISFNQRVFDNPVLEIDFRESISTEGRQIDCSIYFQTGQIHYFREGDQWFNLSDINCKIVYEEDSV